jgi:hypothetical protein
MTLGTMNRPKSKQMKTMPSLKNSSVSSKRNYEVKAFSGAGVRLGGHND